MQCISRLRTNSHITKFWYSSGAGKDVNWWFPFNLTLNKFHLHLEFEISDFLNSNSAASESNMAATSVNKINS